MIQSIPDTDVNSLVRPSTLDTPTVPVGGGVPDTYLGGQPTTPTTNNYIDWHSKVAETVEPGASYWDVLKMLSQSGPTGFTSMKAAAQALSDVIAKDPDHPVRQAAALAAKTAETAAIGAMIAEPAGGLAAGIRGTEFGLSPLGALSKLRPAAMAGNALGRVAWSGLEGGALGAGAGALQDIANPQEDPLGHIRNEALGWGLGGAALHGIGETVGAAWKATTKWAFVDRGKITMPQWGDSKAYTISPRPEELAGKVDEALATNQVVRAALRAGLKSPDGNVNWQVIRDLYEVNPDKIAPTFEEMGKGEKLSLAKMINWVHDKGIQDGFPKTLENYKLFPKGLQDINEAQVSLMQKLLGANPAAANRGSVAFRRFIGAAAQSFRKWSENYGPAGKFISDMFDSAQQRAILHSAPWVNQFQDSIQGMSKAERFNLTDVIEAKDIPLNDKVKSAAETWKTVSNAVAAKAKEAGVMVRDGDTWRAFQPRDNYFPRMWTQQSVDALPDAERVELFRQASELSGKRVIGNTKDFLDRMYGAGSPVREKGGWELADVVSANLQHTRVADLGGYERDAANAIPVYLMKAGQSIAATEHFGPKLGILDGLLKNIQDASGRGFVTDRFVDVSRKVVGGWQDPSFNDLYNITSSFEILSKLGFPATLKHFPGQFLNGWVKSGTINQFAAIGKLLAKDPELVQLLRDSGVNLRNIIPHLSHTADYVPGANFSNTLTDARNAYTNLIGLNKGVAVQRNIASVAGILEARSASKALVSLLSKGGGEVSPAARKLLTSLENLGLNSEKILARGGSITSEEASAAGLRHAMDTQLMGRYGDLPAMAHGTTGKFFNLFKSAAFQQALYDKNYIFKPLVQFINSGGKVGDIKPAIRWAVRAGVATPIIGAFIAGARQAAGAGDAGTQAVAGSAIDVTLGPTVGAGLDLLGGGLAQVPAPQHKNPIANFIEAMNSDGELGLWADLLTNIKSGDQLGNAMLGPIVTDAAQGGGAIAKTFQDASPNPLARYAVGHIPIMGRAWAKSIPTK